MSERSLRRLLSEHEITFKELKSEVFLQRASYYLEYTNMTISQIAYELGYSEPSSFNRAFKSYCDQTPDVFRKKNSNID
jgi:AraC-like DNA-binding protein